MLECFKVIAFFTALNGQFDCTMELPTRPYIQSTSPHTISSFIQYLCINTYVYTCLDGDYTVHSQQSFAVGTSSYSESREICFDVATSDDDVSEGTEVETFQLLLSTEVAWVVLDMPRETTVDLVILDNDGKLKKNSVACYSLPWNIRHL